MGSAKTESELDVQVAAPSGSVRTEIDGRPKAAYDPERARLAKVYGNYRSSGREAARWADEAPGNRCILEERSRATARWLHSRPRPAQILEIGCGAGTVLRSIQDILGPGTSVHGIDLLFERLEDAAGAGRYPVQGDGRRLPYRDDQFDLVVVHTVFSSVLDPTTREALARELRRVLASDGAILWYDMRYPSANRSVRPLTRARLQALFPELEVQVEAITVLPPVARCLGSRDRLLYPWLSRIPLLRSHLIGLITVPSTRSPIAP